MYANKVEICGINTSKLPIMKDVEMKDMIERIRSGDRALRDEFITGNLRLVLSVIQKFQNRGENMDDLFQVGCIGLIKALDNFDPSHEVKFSTYAVPMNVRRRGTFPGRFPVYTVGEISQARKSRSARPARSHKPGKADPHGGTERLSTVRRADPHGRRGAHRSGEIDPPSPSETEKCNNKFTYDKFLGNKFAD